MASADFCPITPRIAPGGAPRLMWQGPVAYPHLSVWASVRLPNCNDTSRMPVEQISPDKDVNFRYTTVAFTLSPEPGASLCRANYPETGPYMPFLFVGS